MCHLVCIFTCPVFRCWFRSVLAGNPSLRSVRCVIMISDSSDEFFVDPMATDLAEAGAATDDV